MLFLQEDRDRLLMEEPDTNFEYRTPEGAFVRHFSPDPSSLGELATDYDICVTGDALTHAHGKGALDSLVPVVQVRVGAAGCGLEGGREAAVGVRWDGREVLRACL